MICYEKYLNFEIHNLNFNDFLGKRFKLNDLFFSDFFMRLTIKVNVVVKWNEGLN